MNAVIDANGLVGGHAAGVADALPPLRGLESVIDFESTGRNRTAARALHLMARGAHVSGFVLRPDDGLSDVAIVSNGVTRFLSPGEMQWLMHESAGRSILVEPSDEVEHLRMRVGSLREKLLAQQEVITDLMVENKKLKEGRR